MNLAEESTCSCVKDILKALGIAVLCIILFPFFLLFYVPVSVYIDTYKKARSHGCAFLMSALSFFTLNIIAIPFLAIWAPLFGLFKLWGLGFRV